MQRADQWAGEDYEGTSVLAGAKIMKSFGYFDEYRWAFNLKDALLAVAYEGPIVIGVNWYEGMYDPSPKGYLKVEGENVGGHAILVSSVSVTLRRVTVWNSWGRSWGDEGRAFLTWDALERLLDEDGDACVPVGRHVV